MEIEYLVVHCSDTPDGAWFVAEDIHRWHRDERGWDGIGYHAVIRRDGVIEPGRPEYWQGAHVRDFDRDGQGDNSDSLSVCMIGRSAFSAEQYRALVQLLDVWAERYPNAEVVGHRDLDSRKTCPNFDVRRWWAEQSQS